MCAGGPHGDMEKAYQPHDEGGPDGFQPLRRDGDRRRRRGTCRDDSIAGRRCDRDRVRTGWTDRRGRVIMVPLGPAERVFRLSRGMVRMGADHLLIGDNLLARTGKDQHGRTYQDIGIRKLAGRAKIFTIHPDDRLDHPCVDRDLDTDFRSNSSQADTRLYYGKGSGHLHPRILHYATLLCQCNSCAGNANFEKCNCKSLTNFDRSAL